MKLLSSLKSRIAITIFVLEILMVITILSNTMGLFTEKSEELITYTEHSLLDLLQRFARNAILTDEYSELQTSVDKILEDEHVKKIVIVNYDNHVLVSTDTKLIGREFLEPTTNNHHHYWKHRRIDNLYSIYVLFSNEKLNNLLDEAMQQGWLVAIICMTIIALSSIAMGWILTKRLRLLQLSAHAISDGDYNNLVNLKGDDEISQLGESFNNMTRKIKSTVLELEARETSLRKTKDKLKQYSLELEEKVKRRTQKLEEVNEALRIMATTDYLTQVLNRNTINDLLSNYFSEKTNENSPFSLIICDIDYFKQYNDTYGHQAGDKCLKSVAEILTNCARREDDKVIRYGGEEFILLLPFTTLQNARQIAHSIQSKLKNACIEHKGSSASPYVTLSIGISYSNNMQPDKFDQLISLADEALYSIKQSGRNSIADRVL